MRGYQRVPGMPALAVLVFCPRAIQTDAAWQGTRRRCGWVLGLERGPGLNDPLK